MKVPTKKQLYQQLSELQAERIKAQEEKEQEQQKAFMVYYDGAYGHLIKTLKSAFGGQYRLVKFEHVDESGFWFSFELANDNRRQTYRVSHEEAKLEYIKEVSK